LYNVICCEKDEVVSGIVGVVDDEDEPGSVVYRVTPFGRETPVVERRVGESARAIGDREEGFTLR
jgi:hypothetical protein